MFPRYIISLIATVYLLLIPLEGVTINTKYGVIEGGTISSNDPTAVFPSNINSFIGIPYARPPIGPLRFKSPQEPDQYTINPYPANGNIDNIASCPHICTGVYPFCPAIQSEDCLTLSIYTPLDAVPNQSNYPVMIWIHGGGFDFSWGNFYAFDPQNLMNSADNKVIVVNINYRLGILGTLYDNRYNTGVRGNFGFEDQKLAIKYVYENILNFGGNPDDITIFGESAGAHSVAFHLLYNNEYIKRGILQSPTFGLSMKNPTTWGETATQFSNIIGCDTTLSATDLVECWQNVDVNDIVQVQSDPFFVVKEGYDFTPTVDTDLLPNDPIFEFKKSNNKYKIPSFIVGTNHDEGYLFINEAEKETTTYSDIVNKLTERLSNNADAVQAVLNYYDITEISTGSTDNYLYSYAEIITDHDYKCSARNVLKNGKIKGNIYHYSLENVDINLNSFIYSSFYPQCVSRTCHFLADIGLVFTNGRSKAWFDAFGPNSVALSKQVQKWWTNFAITNDPNGNSQDDVWPIYVTPKPRKGIVDNSLRIIDIENYQQTVINDPNNDDDDLCVFWDSIGYAGKYLKSKGSPSSSYSAKEDDLGILYWSSLSNNDARIGDISKPKQMAIILSSSWVWMMAILFIILLSFNICLICYKNSEKGNGYLSVKQGVDSEFYDSEKNNNI